MDKSTLIQWARKVLKQAAPAEDHYEKIVEQGKDPSRRPPMGGKRR